MDLRGFLIKHEMFLDWHEHPAVMTCAQSDQLVPALPGAKAKNLFLRGKKGLRSLLVTAPSDRHVDLRLLGDVLGLGRLGFASPERLQEDLGVTPGSVSLLALVNDTAHAVDFVIDRSLWEADAIQAHPLVNTATCVIPHEDLVRFLAITQHSARVLDIPVQPGPLERL
jgi:Ala-tRNA(Pro) deacylase